jgi:hypothetical protein
MYVCIHADVMVASMSVLYCQRLGFEFREKLQLKLSLSLEDLKEDRREAELVEHQKGVVGIWSQGHQMRKEQQKQQEQASRLSVL